MPALTIFYNENSSPPQDLTDEELQQWFVISRELYQCLKQAQEIQPDIGINFPPELLFAITNNSTLHELLKTWLGVDKYSWLQSRLSITPFPLDSNFEIQLNGNAVPGFSCAFKADSWTFSFPIGSSAWLNPSINAQQVIIAGNNTTSTACNIRNLALSDHAVHWQQEIVGWALQIVNDNIIGEYDNYLIVMYPRDHGHPHVHLVERGVYNALNHRKTLAKYRVDQFERMEGRPTWDTGIRAWIEGNRQSLLRSWAHCLKGGHPYKIT